MNLLYYPDPHLQVKCKPVEKVTSELQAIAKEMMQVMLDNAGIGLAAPQVGLDIRLIVLKKLFDGTLGSGNDPEVLALFNPAIVKKSAANEYGSEACLSFPKQERDVKRAFEVTVKYRDWNNMMAYKVFRGLAARAVQHEIDHLDGKTLMDYPIE